MVHERLIVDECLARVRALETVRTAELRPGPDDGLLILTTDAGRFQYLCQAARLAHPRSREVIKAFLARFTDEYAEPVSRVLAEEKRVHSEDRRVQVYRLFRAFGAGFESL